jgi:hypothetical protein
MRIRLPRPIGIRNGGLLLVLVALAAVMALVDRPPEPGGGDRRLPGVFQSLPPPVGITQLPPTVAEPVAAGERPAAQAGTDERVAARRHPLRVHPRPADRPGSSGGTEADRALTAAAGGGGQAGTGATTRPPATPPPVDAAPAPVARVRVPPVSIRVTPPPLLGRDLPDVQVTTPEVTAEARAAAARRLPPR